MVTENSRFAYERFLVWRDDGTYRPIRHSYGRERSVSEICEVLRLFKLSLGELGSAFYAPLT